MMMQSDVSPLHTGTSQPTESEIQRTTVAAAEVMDLLSDSYMLVVSLLDSKLYAPPMEVKKRED
jgi:hypothetical protein